MKMIIVILIYALGMAVPPAHAGCQIILIPDGHGGFRSCQVCTWPDGSTSTTCN